MKGRRHLLGLIFCLAFGVPPQLLAQEWDPSSGELIPGSESPDKQFAFFEIFRVPTTSDCVCIADSGRTKVFSLVHCNTKYGTDKPYKDFLSIVWNKTSQAVAVQDCLEKHSKVFVFLFIGKTFIQAKLPDIYGESLAALKLNRSSIKSSGQMPLRWSSARELEVEQRLVTDDGKTLKRKTTIKPALP